MSNSTNIYSAYFRAIDLVDEMMVCSARDSETTVPADFMKAHGIGLGDFFLCKVDGSGSIILETMKNMDWWR